MNRHQVIGNYLRDNDFVKIESDLIHSNIFSTSEKEVIKLLIRNSVKTANLLELIEAKKIAEHVIQFEFPRTEYYKEKLQKIIKALDNL